MIMPMRYFVTRIANESAVEYQKRKNVELGEAERQFPLAEKERRMRDGVTLVYKGKEVAYFADK
jgi:hypothetical protein